MDYAELSEALAEGFPSLSPQLQLAARHVLDRPDDVALMSMRGLAANAGVHPTTMVRLAKRFDFESFNDFRRPFQKRLRGHPSDYARRARELQSRAGSPPHLVAEVMDKGIDNLRQSFEVNGAERIQQAAEVIDGAERVFVAGLRSCYPVAFFFHYLYRVFRDNAVLLHSQGGTFSDALRTFTENDVLVAVSFEPYTKETVAAAEFARARGGRTVSITDSLVSPLARGADSVLMIENESPSFFHSVAPAMSVVEALVALLVARGGPAALAAISESEGQLHQFDTYWHAAYRPRQGAFPKASQKNPTKIATKHGARKS